MRRVFLFATLLVLGTAGAAPAQLGYRISLQFQLGGDTAIGVLGGKDFVVTVSGNDVAGYGVDSFAVRVPFDAARLAFVSATKLCPDTTVPLNTSVGANGLTVSTASCKAASLGEQPLFRLTFNLSGTTVDGTWLSVVPLALIDNATNSRLRDAAVNVAQVCHATGLWGDVSGDGIVNSLDALVTLSGAVGLSTGPYSLTNADVDGDGQVTSRDALIMLSAGIGLSTSGFRVNKGIVDRCAAQITLPRPLYFSRAGVDPGVAGVSGLTIRTANDSSVAIAGDSSDVSLNNQWRPRVSPDGTHILFVCDNPYYYYPGVCKADANGGNVVHLTLPLNNDVSPDWSPDGTRIVWVHNNAVWVMDSAGGNRVQAPGPAWFNVTSVAWDPALGSNRVAYTNALYCGEIHVSSVDTAATDVAVEQFFSCAAGYQPSTPRFIDWDAAGDSLLFDVQLDAGTVVAAIPNAVGAGLDIRVMMTNAAEHPAWTDQGILFVAANTGPYRLFLQRPDRSIVQVRPDKVDNFLPGMKRVP